MDHETLLIGLSGLLLLQVLLTYRSLRRALVPGRRPARLRRYPSVTVIRPIKGVDVGLEQNVLAALNTGYPGEVEILFVFDHIFEPAVPVVERLIRERRVAGWPDNARILYCGVPPEGRTGKLHAMIAGFSEAVGEVVAFADSDIRPDRLALTVLVETLYGAPDAGAAFVPVVVCGPIATVGDAGYALLINGLYGAAAARAARRRGGSLSFIMGQLMAFRREALEAIGGVEAAEGQLVDDMYLGACVTAAGYRNLVAPHPVPIIQQGLGLADFLRLYRRWITFSRSGLPGLTFKLVPMLQAVVFWIGLLVAGLGLATGSWATVPAAALLPLSVTLVINALHRALGGAPLRPRHKATAALLLLLSPAILLSIYLTPQVSWRGRSYRLDRRSRLASRSSSP